MIKTNVPRPLALLAAGLFVALWSAWFVQAFGLSGPTHSAGRIILPLLLALGLPLAALSIGRWVFGADESERWNRWVIASMLALSLLVRLVGADHEVGERAYEDEGTYIHHAQEINQGKPWRWSFVYGHVSYYSGAFALWISELFPKAWASVARAWSGTEEPLAHQWLVLRLLVALLSAVTVLPVFAIARCIVAPRRAAATSPGGGPAEPTAGRIAGSAAALLFIFSPVFNDGSHLIISDYPSACLATFCLYFVARIAFSAREREVDLRIDYALAGLFAGLAAATKYPAGIVALSIPSVWLIRSVKHRRLFSRDVLALVLATATAVVTFVATMPTFLREPHYAIFAPRGMLYGVRQYAAGGWIGVVPKSLFGYYASTAAEGLGWVALAALLLAPFFLPRAATKRWLMMAFFPALFVGLLVTMSMVVKRNLAPAEPMLSVLAGVGLWALGNRLASWLPRSLVGTNRVWLMTGVLLLGLAQPIVATTQQMVGLARQSTREVAAAWMIANLPEGTRVFRESYTPRLPPSHFFLRRARFAARVPPEEIEREGYQYVLLAGVAFGRFFDPDQRTETHHDVMAERYDDMFTRYPETKRFSPGRWRRGPTLFLLEVKAGEGGG